MSQSLTNLNYNRKRRFHFQILSLLGN